MKVDMYLLTVKIVNMFKACLMPDFIATYEQFANLNV
jgi:hypothetical protein